MMRNILTAIAVLFVAGCSSANATEGAVEMRIVASGSYASASPSERLAVLASDDASYRQQWSSLIGGGEIADVDFETETAVFLLAGERRTGGYAIEPKSAVVEDQTLVIEAAVHAPPPGGIVTQVITSPYAVIAVKTRGVTAVRWER